MSFQTNGVGEATLARLEAPAVEVNNPAKAAARIAVENSIRVRVGGGLGGEGGWGKGGHVCPERNRPETAAPGKRSQAWIELLRRRGCIQTAPPMERVGRLSIFVNKAF